MTAYAKLNGVDCVEARVSIPRTGVWTAEVVADASDVLAGPAALELGGVGFLGTVQTCTVYQAQAHVRIVGGAAALSKQLPAKAYYLTPISIVLSDICTESGEKLSTAIDPAVGNFMLRHWMRGVGTAGQAITEVLDAVDGASWRVLPSGLLWAGVETWPDASVDHELLHYEPFGDELAIFSLQPALPPGSSFLGRHVSYVEHRVSPVGIRTHLWLEAAA